MFAEGEKGQFEVGPFYKESTACDVFTLLRVHIDRSYKKQSLKFSDVISCSESRTHNL